MRPLMLSLLVVVCAACGGDDDRGGGDGGPPGPWTAGPGVDIAVTDLEIDGETARVEFVLKDAAGAALDLEGRLTEGAVGVSFVLAQLGAPAVGAPGPYTAYTLRTVERQHPTPDASVTATQATTEPVSAGTLEVLDVAAGRYRYTFAAPLAGFDDALTQSVLAVAVREVGEVESIDRDLFSMNPSGGAIVAREEVTTAACTSCHGALAAHGGRYTEPAQCVLCHTAQTSDPDSGNTVDFRVMIHKIHAGEHLPSLAADPARRYVIYGFMGVPHDYSDVAFPGPSDAGTNLTRCETCHQGAQGEAWRTQPSIAACTSCHDTTVFALPDDPPRTVAHPGGVDPALVNDATCVVCHGPTSGVSPITQTHYRGTTSPALARVELELLSITDTAPGARPTITLRARVGGAPRDLLAAPLTNLAVTVAGPTTDIATYWQARIQGTGAVGALTAVDAAAGVFAYTLPEAGCTDPRGAAIACALPAEATGSYEVGLEGYLQPTPADPRAAAFSPVLPFAVTDPVAVPRRVIVTEATCNGCHVDLAAHGGSRKNPNYCVLCHNPNKAGDTRAPRVEGPGTVLAPSVDLRVMIHKIHMGDELTQPYVLGGFPAPNAMNPQGTQLDFGDVRYPRARTECGACHLPGTWTLPMDRSPAYLPSTALELTCSEAPAADADRLCALPSFTPSRTVRLAPATSVCTSCHDAPHALAHALVNTTPEGVEACATCHGVGQAWDVTTFHTGPL